MDGDGGADVLLLDADGDEEEDEAATAATLLALVGLLLEVVWGRLLI